MMCEDLDCGRQPEGGAADDTSSPVGWVAAVPLNLQAPCLVTVGRLRRYGAAHMCPSCSKDEEGRAATGGYIASASVDTHCI